MPVTENYGAFQHYVLQGNYGGVTGWEDLTAEDTIEEIKARMRDYLTNEPNTPLRVQMEFDSGKRRTLNPLNLWN